MVLKVEKRGEHIGVPGFLSSTPISPVSRVFSVGMILTVYKEIIAIATCVPSPLHIS